MYHEFRSTLRDAWRFEYTARELLGFAERRLAEYYTLEREARERVSSLMLDKSVPASDKRITEARTAVETNGAIHEQLLVWVHEFGRNPEKTYTLSLGDVVFFDLTRPSGATEEPREYY